MCDLKDRYPVSQMHCQDCYCKNCLYWWSSRCIYGKCWDDFRAKKNPYNKVFPDKSPRKGWSSWGRPGEQAHWCRGGVFYPERKCEHYVKYTGSTTEECVEAPIQIFQDGYISCTFKDLIGCEACVARAGGKNVNDFACEYMRDTGCEKMYYVKDLILRAIQEGENIEPCKEQCCLGCQKSWSCGFQCGQIHK